MSRTVCISGNSSARIRYVDSEKESAFLSVSCACFLEIVQDLEAELKNQSDAAATKLQQLVRSSFVWS